MKIGAIVRAENRGIGLQSWEFVRHVQPDRVLVVDVQNQEGFSMHLDRYPGATVARLQGGRWLAETLVREWLDELDVVFSVETLYDWRVADWAREAGVATVVQCNPEMFAHRPGWHEAEPTVWWNPTTWRARYLPADARHVPVPVALDRFESRQLREPRQLDGEPRRLRALHIVGRTALGDRNGTEIVQAAAKRTQHVEWTVRAQKPTDHAPRALGAVPDYWRLYDDQDVLVMPRRYGGLCLPAQEAMAAGLAVAMPACPPNLDWPVIPLRWKYKGHIGVPAGQVPLAVTDPDDLARRLDELALAHEALGYYRTEAKEWARAHSWEALLPLYEAELEHAFATNLAALTP